MQYDSTDFQGITDWSLGFSESVHSEGTVAVQLEARYVHQSDTGSMRLRKDER